MPKRRAEPPEPWWVQRWLEQLDAYGDEHHTRLMKGRSYANNGRIFDVAIQPGRLSARAHGSYGEIYSVRLDVPQLLDAAWKRVAVLLASRADWVALLLGGDLPEPLETIFDQAGAALFPNARALHGHCTCFDWGDPCKHVFGLYYAFAAPLRTDPSLLFELRGSSRDDLLRIVQRAWTSTIAMEGTGETDAIPMPPATPATPAEPPSVTAPLRLDHFFTSSAPLDALDTPITAPRPETDGALIRRLGRPAFAREPEDVVTPLARAYAAVSRRALVTFKRSAAKHLLRE